VNDNIIFELFACFFNFKKNQAGLTTPFLNILDMIKKLDKFAISFDEYLNYLFHKLYVGYLVSKDDSEFKNFYFLRGENYKQLCNNKHYFTVFLITLAIAMLSSDIEIYKANCDDLLFFYNTLTNNLCRTYCGK
jgi:hypothetical protein